MYLLLRRSLKFCPCTTWFLDFDHLVRINRAWLYKDPKVSVLQANAPVAQLFFFLVFLNHLMPILPFLSILCKLWKTRLEKRWSNTYIDQSGPTLVTKGMVYSQYCILKYLKKYKQQGCARLAEISSELTKSWSSGATEFGIGNCKC